MAAEAPVRATARRVVRRLSDDFSAPEHMRKDISYRGGWQNSTQKLQWFWFGFKKYGFLNNVANCLRMRESWWETGEKRLVGMDAMGINYWETDDIPRGNGGQGTRLFDPPHHFIWTNYLKFPKKWHDWLRGAQGRSPPAMDALLKELGPTWRDYATHEQTPTEIYNERDAEPRVASGLEAYWYAAADSSPFSPNFHTMRRYYGATANFEKLHSLHMRTGVTNLYSVDEFDPAGGKLTQLAYEGLGPDNFNQYHMYNNLNKERKLITWSFENNWAQRHGAYDGGKWSRDVWFEWRSEQAQQTRDSRRDVSAFDHETYALKNTTGLTFGFMNRYKQLDPYTEEGYARSRLNPKNHFRYKLSDVHQAGGSINQELRDEYMYRKDLRDTLSKIKI